MSIWARFTRFVKSVFGGAISALEDPKLILEQNIRELNDQVPKMNENIATVKANVMMLQKEVRKYENELTDLTSKIKAGIQAGRDDIAPYPGNDDNIVVDLFTPFTFDAGGRAGRDAPFLMALSWYHSVLIRFFACGLMAQAAK